MRRFLPLLVTGFFYVVTAHSQENLHFSVDRPGIADLPTTVPVGHLQIESGLEYYQRELYRTMFLPTVLLRTGITKSIEVRGTLRYLRTDSVRESQYQRNNLGLGLDIKAKLIREKGVIPATALLIGDSFVSTNIRQFKGPLWGQYVLLLMENNLHDKVLFNYNAGLVWNGNGTAPSKMYALCFEVELHENAAIFIEQSTFFNVEEKNDYWVDAGYTHLVARHSQLDFSIGTNLNGEKSDYFVALGFSTRFNLRKN